ncbi:CU044_5270 family protein [Actinomadura barringtoniae]|uniref:CU044_5270 family protein n=1 Tax=Actinomadura barringtoniae TaxID=1427535 RepID=A0A939T417_9ACTN|nr:CU044_5270 family protein [Actinomadura barringtoniae]MBO2452001.1 CU044_5270 family protein [Actinomadura barringtoniae]
MDEYDEFTGIATLLAKPGPSQETVDEGRHRLHNAMLDPAKPRTRRTGWLAGGLGLTATAAAAAAAIAITSSGTSPAHNPNSPPQAAPMTARQVLLSAATAAEKVPDKGAYWYVKELDIDGPGAAPVTTEHWTARDGKVWVRGLKTEGKVEKLTLDRRWSLGGPDVTFAQLQHLPVDPDRLKAWIADNIKHSDVRTGAGRPDAAMRRSMTFEGLYSLICTLPTTSKTRAAAFRAIAAYPGVKNSGRTPGGQRLEMRSPQGDDIWLVVDPATSKVVETNWQIPPDGGTYMTPGSFKLVSQWTDVLPK